LDDAIRTVINGPRLATMSNPASYPELLGTSIGKVLSLEEQSSPVYSSPFPTVKAGAADAAAIEIDLGEQDVAVTIAVRWALN
jgi:hypothetical protein